MCIRDRCEAACTCGDVTGSSVTVRENEHAIIETAYAKGWLLSLIHI